jgi:DNA (cytosine-5)-methyltransferase 1
LSDKNLERIKASKPGGTWRDWPEHLVADCHRTESGRTYASVYGRMEWDKPAPTMTTQCYGFGNGRFGHPEQNRAISLREAAILQSFPRNYAFIPHDGPVSLRILGRLIGNAVPVELGRAIARSINSHLANVNMVTVE